MVILLGVGTKLAFPMLEVAKQLGVGFMTWISSVDLEFVNTVRIIITGIATHLYRVTNIEILEAPFVAGSSFLNVID